jgi:hypothetical protein
VTGHARTGDLIIYRLDYSNPALGNSQTWRLTQGVNGDCDLYVRYNSAPTLFYWDYANVSSASETTVSFQTTTAQRGFWYAGVYGFAECDYTLRVDSNTRCPNSCSNRGQCNNAVCACQSGFSGSGCETSK